MRINNDNPDEQQKRQLRQDLQLLLQQPSDKQLRPCPGCGIDTPNVQADTTQCSSKCPMAARQMSSEPVRYPIEPAMVPLVYAFFSSRLMTPCWSCEGHNDAAGQSSKPPGLWFYSHAPFYPRLVAQFVNDLKARHRIHYDWSVRLLPFSQSTYSLTYALEPLDFHPGVTRLTLLQQDMQTIAEHFNSGITTLAQNYLNQIGPET